MKHFIIFILFAVLFSALGNAQARLGFTEDQIAKEFKDRKYNFTIKTTEENVRYISIEFSQARVLYYLDDKKVCNMTVILPSTQADMKFFIEQYNKDYVIITPTKWNAYMKGMVAEITLVMTNDWTMFVWIQL